MTNKQTFASTLAVLSGTFRQQLEKEAIEGYWLALEDLAEDEFKLVCKRALRECKFMPSPAELLAFAGKGGQKAMTVRTAEAWEAVRSAMDRHDYTTSVDFGPLVNAVVANLGGWQTLCDKSIPDLVWVRKDFERLYEAFCEKDPSSLHGDPLRGAFGGPPVRIAIGGVTPPRQLNGKRSEIATVVRELAEGKSLPS